MAKSSLVHGKYQFLSYIILIIVMICIAVWYITNELKRSLGCRTISSTDSVLTDNTLTDNTLTLKTDVIMPSTRGIDMTAPYLTMPNEYTDPRINLYRNRIFDPLQYPYRSYPYVYDDVANYANIVLPAPAVGCGHRNEPCMGGSEEVIVNRLPALDISNANIARVNMRTRGPISVPQQVGVLYKIFGNNNIVLPLYGRKKYPNGTQWDYYTIWYKTGVKLRVYNTNGTDNELGDNDEVYVDTQEDKYRVTIYEHDFPQYVPYI